MHTRAIRLSVVTACLLGSASLASAQATRTWVSGVGDDANPCSRTAPCKTFAGALSKTAAGGEISVLDPGGFGAVTITKSITIDGHGVVASTLGSFTNGITINAGASVVILRHLQINGAGNGLVGIQLNTNAALIVNEVEISGFQTGIQVNAGNATIMNSTIANNASYGINGAGGTTTVEHSTLASNNVAVVATSPGTVRLSDNGIYNNLTGFGCGGGVLASAGNNRKAGNTGGSVPVCAPTQAINIQ